MKRNRSHDLIGQYLVHVAPSSEPTGFLSATLLQRSVADRNPVGSDDDVALNTIIITELSDPLVCDSKNYKKSDFSQIG